MHRFASNTSGVCVHPSWTVSGPHADLARVPGASSLWGVRADSSSEAVLLQHPQSSDSMSSTHLGGSGSGNTYQPRKAGWFKGTVYCSVCGLRGEVLFHPTKGLAGRRVDMGPPEVPSTISVTGRAGGGLAEEPSTDSAVGSGGVSLSGDRLRPSAMPGGTRTRSAVNPSPSLDEEDTASSGSSHEFILEQDDREAMLAQPPLGGRAGNQQLGVPFRARPNLPGGQYTQANSRTTGCSAGATSGGQDRSGPTAPLETKQRVCQRCHRLFQCGKRSRSTYCESCRGRDGKHTDPGHVEFGACPPGGPPRGTQPGSAARVQEDTEVSSNSARGGRMSGAPHY